MRPAFLALLISAVSTVCVSSTAGATPAPSPIKVMRCDLQVRGGRAGGYSTSTAYTGYKSGYAPGTPYTWGDPFGHTYYQPPTSGSSNLFIDFMNVTQKAMKAIDFGADVSGAVIAEARDTGTFAPNAEIKRKYGVNPLAVPRESAKITCVPLKIEYADGTVWTDQELPPASKTLYQSKP
jgi:hypothetical protein